MSVPNDSLLARIAQCIGEPPSFADEGVEGSILTASARFYGSRPEHADATHPDGFDPVAAALFEAVVEAAYLVANADGVFDPTEQAAFQHVVLTACGDAIPERQFTALLADLAEQLAEDGMDRRVHMVARILKQPSQAREVLRAAALIAHISEGVSEVERQVMLGLARACDLSPEAVDEAVVAAEHALAP